MQELLEAVKTLQDRLLTDETQGGGLLAPTTLLASSAVDRLLKRLTDQGLLIQD
jgi:hypothetical protein